LGGLLQQLFQHRPDISSDLRSLYDGHHRKETRPTLDELSKLLQTEVRSSSRVFIMVDALDECSEANNTRHKLLVELAKLTKARIFITSRPHIKDVPEYFETYLTMEIRASDDDIRKYVLERISTQRRIDRFVQRDETLKEEISNAIVRTANGM
jgi:NACHT domain